MTKFKIGATIPTVQYGNLMPEIEVEADTFEEAQAIAMPQIQSVWNSVCEPGKELSIRTLNTVTQATKEMVCEFSEEKLFLDESSHTYTDTDGNTYQSGSRFASQFEHPFDKDTILPMYAAKVGQEPAVIDGFWNTKGQNSRDFGHALHSALELYGKYLDLSETLDKPLGIHPLLLTEVESFFADRDDEKALYEVFVASKALKRCGQIDRLVITGDNTCIIEDYKTNGDINKQGSPAYLKVPFERGSPTELRNLPISIYTIQLNFYRTIMESLGWTVEGMRVHHFDEMLETIDIPRVDLP